MEKLTCLSCSIIIASRKECEVHHATEWHRYNIKRRIVGLPPITLADHNKIKSIKDNSKKEENEGIYCKPCKKTFANIKSFNNHSNSKQHKLKLQRTGSSADEVTSAVNTCIKTKDVEEEYEEVDSDEWDEDVALNATPVNQCLFCSLKFESMENNFIHMGTFHSFQIPDIQYCVDVTALMEYLGSKVGGCQKCVYCNRNFQDLISLQKHMNDKWHMRLNTEGENVLEYSDFYDYSSTYPDADTASPDDDANPSILIPDEDFQLVLPSGTIIGHKAMTQYCNRSSKIRALATTHSNTTCVKKLSGYYQSIGWKGATRSELMRRAKDIRAAAAARQHHHMRLGIKANKLQHHFRVQIDF